MTCARTKLVILVISSLITKNLCDSDALKNFSIDRADLLRGSGEEKEIIDDIELENQDTDKSEEVTTTEIVTTTELPDVKEVYQTIDEALKTIDDDDNREADEDTETSITTLDGTDETTDGLDNNVFRTTVQEDIYSNVTNIVKETVVATTPLFQTETTTLPPTTKAMDVMDGMAPRIAEFDEEPESSGQRSPKTENTEPKLPDRPSFEPTQPPATVSAHATLKSWLEDGWLRAPAGILVPLRSSALSRARAVWEDLVAAGLDLKDIVLVGYDSNAAQVDLYNTSSVRAFSPASRTDALSPRDVFLVFPGADPDGDMLSVLPMKPTDSPSAMAGMWHLSVRCDTCDYRLCVAARAQLRGAVRPALRPAKSGRGRKPTRYNLDSGSDRTKYQTVWRAWGQFAGIDQVSISAYIYVVNSVDSSDVWAPTLRHNFQGMCIGKLGNDCAEHAWSATIFARDASTGLLRLTSSPIGIMYDSNFIAGTREEVMATYRATCCAPRLSITAVDANGNVNSYMIDISGYLNGASIAAITLGVFLAIAIIALIIFLIYWCVRRRKESRELPYSTSTRNMN
ncbi:hypothetical protein MSG28_015974 [Choristoneura fumiferana]|uniref:Uncharacterized protein n=1 Tax=Choristoneura fumiferana TaxID=7141 RepID=A0ACC0K5D0_CHOFU|nr:hypothetical protein MSG28_015974 [Choristoneura fumiferana]